MLYYHGEYSKFDELKKGQIKFNMDGKFWARRIWKCVSKIEMLPLNAGLKCPHARERKNWIRWSYIGVSGLVEARPCTFLVVGVKVEVRIHNA